MVAHVVANALYTTKYDGPIKNCVRWSGAWADFLQAVSEDPDIAKIAAQEPRENSTDKDHSTMTTDSSDTQADAGLAELVQSAVSHHASAIETTKAQKVLSIIANGKNEDREIVDAAMNDVRRAVSQCLTVIDGSVSFPSLSENMRASKMMAIRGDNSSSVLIVYDMEAVAETF